MSSVADPITRLNAALEGRYAIERELGEGGMATVYLAKDLKHNRNVAPLRSADTMSSGWRLRSIANIRSSVGCSSKASIKIGRSS